MCLDIKIFCKSCGLLMLRKISLLFCGFIAFRHEAVRPFYEQWASLYTIYMLMCYISKPTTNLCDVQSFAQLLQAPQEEADAIIKERFPVPRLVVCDQYGSQVILFIFYSCLFFVRLFQHTAFSQEISLCIYLLQTFVSPYWG